MKTELKKLEKSQVEISFVMPAEDFAKYVDKALEHLKHHVKMDGFRPGSVPKDIIEKKIGAENVLMEAGELAVRAAYTKYVNENDLEPVSEPNVQIKKIAKGSDFEFAVTVTLLPELQLPDYKAIAAGVKVGDVSVDDKEIEQTLQYLQRSRAKFTDKPEGAAKKDYVKIEYQNESINEGKPVKDIFILGEGQFLPDFEDNLVGMKAGEEKEFKAKFPENAPNNLGGQDANFKVKMLVVQTMELPELNDEFAKQLGAFDSLVALKENLKEGITGEKKENEKQRARGEMLGKIAEKVTVELPEKMVEYELERAIDDLKAQVAKSDISFEKYLESVKKTEEEIKASFRKDAERRLKNFLVLRQIGKQERIEVTTKEIEEEINKTIQHYSKAQADQIDIGQLREYTKGVLFNEKVFQVLESFSQNNVQK